MMHDAGEVGEFVQELMAVGVGGFAGSIGRYLLGLGMRAILPGLPAGTLVANVIAGLIIGVVTGTDLMSPLPANVRLLLAVGLCGGLSTFSTFSSETVQLAEAGNTMGVVLNVVLNVGLCCLAVVVGLRLGKMLVTA